MLGSLCAGLAIVKVIMLQVCYEILQSSKHKLITSCCSVQICGMALQSKQP